MRFVASMFGLCFFACTEARVITAPDMEGMPDSAVSDAAIVDAHTDARMRRDQSFEPEPGGECDQQDNCGACSECSVANDVRCGTPWNECLASADCTALLDCFDPCATQACVDDCGTAHPESTEMVNAVLRCVACVACPADCRDRYTDWCEASPF